MGFVNRAFVAAGVGFAVSAIVGCGSSGGRLLSASESNSLSAQLNRVTEALAAQQCSQARQYLSQFQSAVDNLGDVNSTLISDLNQGASTIQSLADSSCKLETTTTPKKSHPKTSTSTTTTPTQTTATFTTPTYTTPTYTTPTYTQPSTNTTGGTCPTCGATTTTSTSTVPSTTTSNGGTGLGGVDTSTTGTTTNAGDNGGGD